MAGQRLVGSDGRLKTYTLASSDTEQAALNALTTAAGAEPAWYEVAEIAGSNSGFDSTSGGLGLDVGDFWAPGSTARSFGSGDKAKALTINDLSAIVSYDLTLDQPLIDVTALDDTVSVSRFGRSSFSGSITGIVESELSDSLQAILSRALPVVQISSAGVPTKTAKTTAVIPLALFLADAIEGRTVVIFVPAGIVGSARMGVQDGQRQEWSGTIAAGADTLVGRSPTIYYHQLTGA